MDLSVHDGEIPIPISSNYVGGSGSNIQSQSHNSLPFHLHHPSNVPSLPLQTPAPLSFSSPFNSKKTASVKYRECLKNHAASIGGNATDGCGEFMPSGEEGTLEALKCSACNCHRNFHRKEIDGAQSPSCEQCFNFKEGKRFIGQKNAFGPQNLMRWKEGIHPPWSRKGSERSLLQNRRTRCCTSLRKLGGSYRSKKRVWCRNYATRLGSREEFSRFGCITTSITWLRRQTTFCWSEGSTKAPTFTTADLRFLFLLTDGSR